MNLFKSTFSKAMLAISLLCVAAIIFHSAVVSEKNSVIKKLENEISSNKVTVTQATKKADDLAKELDKLKESVSKTQKELNKVKEANSNLEKENNKLKQENSSLKNSKKPVDNKNNNNKNNSQTIETNTVTNGKKVCYLTFDDGPSENTLKVLKILDKYNVKATFFVIDTPKLSYVKKIKAAGHTVGLHSYTHDYKTIYSNSNAYFKDLNAISNAVKKQIGIESKIIRFPGGSSNSQGLTKAMRQQVIKKGYYYFDWNVDSMDASGHNVSYTKIRNSVLTAAKKRNTICVLMHDTNAKDSTVTALPYIIKGLKKQGYTFEALTEKSPGFRHR